MFFWNSLAFSDSTEFGNLISGSSAFSKSRFLASPNLHRAGSAWRRQNVQKDGDKRGRGLSFKVSQASHLKSVLSFVYRIKLRIVTLIHHFKSLLQWDRTKENTHSPDSVKVQSDIGKTTASYAEDLAKIMNESGYNKQTINNRLLNVDKKKKSSKTFIARKE